MYVYIYMCIHIVIVRRYKVLLSATLIYSINFVLSLSFCLFFGVCRILLNFYYR